MSSYPIHKLVSRPNLHTNYLDLTVIFLLLYFQNQMLLVVFTENQRITHSTPTSLILQQLRPFLAYDVLTFLIWVFVYTVLKNRGIQLLNISLV